MAGDAVQSADFFQTLRIIKSGTASLRMNYPADGAVFTETVPHGLGFAPLCQVYVGNNAYNSPLPYITPYGFTTGGGIDLTAASLIILAFVDSDNLYIQGTVSGSVASDITWDFKYYLLQTSA